MDPPWPTTAYNNSFRLYYNRLEYGVIHLLVIYAKSVRGNIPAHLLRAIKEELERDQT